MQRSDRETDTDHPLARFIEGDESAAPVTAGPRADKVRYAPAAARLVPHFRDVASTSEHREAGRHRARARQCCLRLEMAHRATMSPVVRPVTTAKIARERSLDG